MHLPSLGVDHVSVPPPIPPHRGGSDDLDKDTLFTPSLKTGQGCKPNPRSESKYPSEDEGVMMMMTTDTKKKICPISNDYEDTDLPPPPPHKSSALMSGITLQALGFYFSSLSIY